MTDAAHRESRRPFVLGLDIGARSVGWAALALEGSSPSGLLAAGVRCFEAGVEGDLDRGADQPRGQARRMARQVRRQTDRRVDRRRTLLRCLAEGGLLPGVPLGGEVALQRYWRDLDTALARDRFPGGDRVTANTLHYRLRALALDVPLTATELGRAFYQLGKRRGFLSGRKRKRRDDEEEGQVRESIHHLEEAIRSAGVRTLGEYLAGLDPELEPIRRRWTSREMYRAEFAAIWEAQLPGRPELTDALRESLESVLFFQRPLRSQKHRVGECDLVPGRKRAPLACREAQHFRVLQAVNNLRVAVPGAVERPLQEEERSQLLTALTESGDRTFEQIRKLLGLPRGTEFNLARGGEKRMVGNRTEAKLRSVFGPAWSELGDVARAAIADDVYAIADETALVRKAQADWGLDRESAAKLAALSLEPGYAPFSRKALRALLPLLEKGLPLATAQATAFPASLEPKAECDRLPLVQDALPQLRNPAVARALSEVRKVVNAIIERWGKPELLRVELARDLRNSRERRAQMAKDAREREKTREEAADALRKEAGIPSPSRADIERYLLAEECGWECPYTGRRISIEGLFGTSPQFDVEHIWPLARSLDNTFFNKTLCLAEENRTRKGSRTPFEAYGNEKECFATILDRVSRFRGRAKLEKLSRFASEEIPSDFTERHLQDTRYATKLAMKLLGELYGGTVDATGRRRVQAGTGGLTAIVRGELGLNRLLGEGGAKSRADHRHHAIDAIAVALLDAGLVQRLQQAASEAPSRGRRHFAPIESPWPAFLEQAREAISGIVVSHRVSRKVTGPLHDEQALSRPIRPPGSGGGAVVVHRKRRRVQDLSVRDVANIADPVVRRAVETKLAEVGGNAKKLEHEPPTLRGGDGREVAIRSVRVNVPDRPFKLGRPGHERFVTSKENHHLAVVARLDAAGNEVEWEGHLVSRIEANRRLQAKVPVVQREWGEGRRFLFSLAPGDAVEWRRGGEGPQLYRVRSVWLEVGVGRIRCCRAADARLEAEQKKAGESWQPTLRTLRADGFRKIVVGPLGNVHNAGD